MANTIYISAGLPVSKDESIDPSAGVNTAYITAGLPPSVLEEEVGTGLLMLRAANKRGNKLGAAMAGKA